MDTIRLLIADCHPMTRMGMGALFAAEPKVQIVASCADGTSALAAIRTENPDVAFLDIAMPELSGLDILKAVRNEQRPVAAVMVFPQVDERQLDLAISRGATGILLKNAEPAEFLSCLRTVRAGETWISSGLIHKIAQPNHHNGGLAGLHQLTDRERQIFNGVREGLTNKEIGVRLRISEGTVKIHLHNMYRKTAVPNRTSLAALKPTLHRAR